MKKFLVLILALAFVFILSTNILAVPESDIQYSIHDTPTYLGAYFNDNLNYIVDPSLEVVYYKNPETSADVEVSRTSLYLAGSYLSDCGLFLQSVYRNDSYQNYLRLIPGYRYNFTDSSYAALRVTGNMDFKYENNQTLEYNGYGKYSDEKTRLTGGLIFNRYSLVEYAYLNRLISEGFIASGGARLEEVYLQGFNTNLYSGLSYYTDTFVTNLTANLPNLFYHNDFSIKPYFEAFAMDYIGDLGLGADFSLSLDGTATYWNFYLKGKYLLSHSKDSRVNLYFWPRSKSLTLSYIQGL